MFVMGKDTNDLSKESIERLLKELGYSFTEYQQYLTAAAQRIRQIRRSKDKQGQKETEGDNHA